MSMKRFCLSLITALSVATGLHGQDIVATAKISRDSILLGDPVQYTAEIELPAPLQAYFPVIPDSLGNGIELLAPPTIDTVRSDKSTKYILNLLLTAFDSGYTVVPAIPYGVGPSGQITDTSLLSPQVLYVMFMPRDSSLAGDIHDIKPPMREPYTFAELAPWIGLGLLLVAAIVLIIIYLNKRRNNEQFLKKLFKPSEPPHVVALRALALIRDRKLWASDDHKHYYTELTDVLRAYLEGRFGIDAQEKTSAEIIEALRAVDYNFGDTLQQLSDMLATADLVKFAKHTPLIDENERHLSLSAEFVASTKPAEAPEQQNSAPLEQQAAPQQTAQS